LAIKYTHLSPEVIRGEDLPEYTREDPGPERASLTPTSSDDCMNKTIQHMLQLSLDINAGAGKDVISLVPRLIT
jgi:hypothetical protein